MDDKRSIRKQQILVAVAFIAFVIVGIMIFRDYGVSTDELQERNSTLVNANYIWTLLGLEPRPVPALSEWKDRYYGMIMQFPTIIFEIFHWDISKILLGRHFYTFIVCVIGWWFFYDLCKRIYGSRMLALAGSGMLALYPRFFAEQFYNIKDLIFVAVYIASMWAMERMISARYSWKWILVFSMFSAAATNVRLPGLILIVVALCYLWIVPVIERAYKTTILGLSMLDVVRISVMMIGIFALAWIIYMPIAWSNPLDAMVKTYEEFSTYDYDSHAVFMGEHITGMHLPWYYVPVWMMISLPIWYQVCLAISVLIGLYQVVHMVRNKEQVLRCAFDEDRYVTWSLILFIAPWLAIVIAKATLYNAWRHCYFMLPPLVLLDLFGIQFLVKQRKALQYVMSAVIIVGFAVQVRWMVINHPYEMVYFNEIGRQYAAGFDRDYWHLSDYQAYQYIVSQDDTRPISIGQYGGGCYSHILNEEERESIITTDEHPTYYIDTYRDEIGNQLSREGYEEIYAIEVDGYKIASVFRKIDS